MNHTEFASILDFLFLHLSALWLVVVSESQGIPGRSLCFALVSYAHYFIYLSHELCFSLLCTIHTIKSFIKPKWTCNVVSLVCLIRLFRPSVIFLIDAVISFYSYSHGHLLFSPIMILWLYPYSASLQGYSENKENARTSVNDFVLKPDSQNNLYVYQHIRTI